MSKILTKIIRIVIRLTRPLVWKFANAYDLKYYQHCAPTGQHPVVIQGGEFAKNHQIPKSVYFNTRSGSIVVGENTVFGEDVKLLTGKHYNAEESFQCKVPLHYVPESGRDIVIGRGCYIGSGAIIIGKIVIGDYAVIGAGSVVTKNVPAKTFVAGVPAREIRKLQGNSEGGNFK